MRSEIIWESGEQKWVVFGRDPNKESSVIDTNQYLVISKKKGLLIDPGGIDIFPSFLTELIKYVKVDDIVGIVASHQDPDIISSLPMWLDLNNDIKTYCSWIWESFIAHFSMGQSKCLVPIRDSGETIKIGNTGSEVILVPAHYCHSSGNFSVYDPKSEIIFSGDIGAALLPDSEASLYVDSFNEHVQYMEKFHIRWMPSSTALKRWVTRVRDLKPKMICPQHGGIFKGENVDKFLTWLENLEVGRF